MARRKKDSKKYPGSTRSVDNSAKTLLANIRFMRVDDPVKTVVITSAVPNEGKTFISINLARAMATSGVPTLLVDCDMRRRSVARSLGIHAQRGMYAVLSGEISLKEAIVPTDTPQLYFLDAEPHIPNPSDLLNSRRFLELLNAVKQEYGYVVFDTPPVGTFVDAAVLGSKVDAVFLVVREQYTRKDAIVRAADQLRTANAPLSGIVMNFCQSQSSEYYYDYYYYREEQRRSSSGEGEGPLDMVDFNSPSQPLGASESQGIVPVKEPSSWGNAPDAWDVEPYLLGQDLGVDDAQASVESPEPEAIPESEEVAEPEDEQGFAAHQESQQLPAPKSLPERHNGLDSKVPAIDLGEGASPDGTTRIPRIGTRM